MHRLRQRSDRSIVQYLLIQQTREGLWFTVSEWIDALNWGDLIALKQKATAVPPLAFNVSIAAVVDQLKRRISFLFGIMGAISSVLILIWIMWPPTPINENSFFSDIANRYASSMAFVMVEYSLKLEDKILYRNQTEGTAFLGDGEGYLLTNRHVACPWLEDDAIKVLISSYREQLENLNFNYRIFLWFEGQKAFYSTPPIEDSDDVTDSYYLSTAFRSDGVANLKIAGVMRPTVSHTSSMASFLVDDFAVLKIDMVPQGLKPLPLDLRMDPEKIPRLTPVITLGFPLGSQTQASTVNVSVTRGNVRRSFKDLLQVDTSIHKGNSGGPIVDANGKVIGIASGVAITRVAGPLPLITPQSDIGMVTPISRAVIFLEEIKKGHIKWNGVLDFSINSRLENIRRAAFRGQWEQALIFAKERLGTIREPTMYLHTGILQFALGNDPEAQRTLGQAASMDSNDNYSRLVLFLIDWLANKSLENRFRSHLLALDWRSEDELIGFFTRILEGFIDRELSRNGWENSTEKGWLTFASALVALRKGQYHRAEPSLQEALLLMDNDPRGALCAAAMLYRLQRRRLQKFDSRELMAAYQLESKALWQQIGQKFTDNLHSDPSFAKPKADIMDPSEAILEKQEGLKQLLSKDPLNGKILTALVFSSAMGEQWSQALFYSRQFLKRPGRESANRLSIGLLEPELMLKLGNYQQAARRMRDFRNHTQDPWYRAISECLLRERSFDSLSPEISQNPQNMVTAQMALGFWEEGNDHFENAKTHYKEALGSYLDNWYEFSFARERLKQLKRKDD